MKIGLSATAALVAVAAVLAAACEEPDLRVPTASEVASHYSVDGRIETDVSGNVAELVVYQPADQLRRGGSLWAKVGPYVFLFSDATRELFSDFPGLAAVRVITRHPSGTEVARAMLLRSTLNELTWRRALNIAGRARLEGTQRVSLLEDLIRWGEDRTDFVYNPRYTRSR
jgi:hypothetical protein